MKAKRNTQKRLDNLRLEVELDNINQNANLTMAPIRSQIIKPSDMKFLVSQPDPSQFSPIRDALGVREDEADINDITTVRGYEDPYNFPSQAQVDALINNFIERRHPYSLDDVKGSPFIQEWIDIRDSIQREYPQHPTKQQRKLLSKETREALQNWLIDNAGRFDQYVIHQFLIPDTYGTERTQEEVEASNERLLQEQNMQRTKGYVSRIQNTNLGELNTQKLEGESDENYLQRMQSLQNSMPSQERILANEKEKEKMEFRNNLQKVASPTVSEAIINDEYFKGDNGSDIIRILVRAWPSFLKELKETYSKLDLEAFMDFTHNWVDKIQNTKGVKNPVIAGEPEIIVVPPNSAKSLSALNDDGTITIRNLAGRSLTIGVKNGKPWNFTTDKGVAPKTLQLFPSHYNYFGTTHRQFLDKFAEMVAALSEGPTEFFNNLLESPPPRGPRSVITINAPEKDDPRRRTRSGTGFKNIPKHRKKFGHGISTATDSPEYREFGRLIVNIPKLTDGILRVLYASNGINVAGIKSTHISPDFVDLIMTILDTEKFNPRLFDRLPISEKPLFKKLIDIAKLKHKLGANNLVDENEKQQLQRWEIVRGEIESGNDNISLRKEAKKLISYFMKSGRLSKSEAYDLLIQLSL